MNENLFYVINEDGTPVNARALIKFKLNDNDYLVYTYNEINENEMIKIYVTGIESNSYKEISSDDEWNNVKDALKVFAKDSSPLGDNFVSNIKVLGEEISIRKPKKLLVSQKFANTLASKYGEEPVGEPKTIEPAPVVEPKVEEKVTEPVVNNISENELKLEKTIKIPTFEELQARSKTIQNAMNSVTKEEIKKPVTEEKTVVYDQKINSKDYEEQFKKDVEPVLLDVYAKQQKRIEELEEELSKTKFDLFEKQKEALSLNNEKAALQEEIDNVNKKMDGILNVIQGNKE
ncbi:MAG: DUF1292 domain-containing protein [Bacilli bacterium]|nr:DUF1292 domain-containing protein [Bacilli bacterium]